MSKNSNKTPNSSHRFQTNNSYGTLIRMSWHGRVHQSHSFVYFTTLMVAWILFESCGVFFISGNLQLLHNHLSLECLQFFFNLLDVNFSAAHTFSQNQLHEVTFSLLKILISVKVLKSRRLPSKFLKADENLVMKRRGYENVYLYY